MTDYVDIQPTPDAPLHASTGPVVAAEDATTLATTEDVSDDSDDDAEPEVETTIEDPDLVTPAPVTASTPTYYKHIGTGEVDSSVWPDSGKEDADGDELYTFTGDTEPGDTNGVSSDWVVTSAV